MKHFVKFLFVLMALVMAVPPAWADETLTVCDQNTTNSYYLPFYGQGYYIQSNQMIYPESMLEDMVGTQITGLTFYASAAMQSSGAVYNVSLGTTSQATYSTATAITGLSVVATGKTLTSGLTEVVIPFDESFNYSGGNLVVEITVTTGGTYTTSSSFVGVSQSSSTSYYSYSFSGGSSMYGYVQSFLPKATFSYEGELQPYAARITPAAIDFGKATPGASLTQNVTVKNTGSNAFTPSVSGLSAPFSTTYTPAELPSGETATIPVIFNPSTTGEYTANLQVGSTDGNIAAVSIPLTGNCVNEMTVCDGTDQNAYLPVYGNYFEQDQINQMVYPASMLSGMAGKKITAMTFYPQNGIRFYKTLTTNGTVTFSLGNLDANTAEYESTPVRKTGYSAVATIQMPETQQTSLTEWVITFDEPFEYTGGDLLLDVATDHGNYGNTYFYGVEQSGYPSYNSYGGGAGTRRNFLPKVTFAVEDAVVPATLAISPESLTINDAAVGTFDVTGTGITDGITAVLGNAADWSITPSLTNDGGTVAVSYMGTALSASNTVIVSASGVTDATAAVNYIADLYIIGDYGNGWSFAEGTPMTYSNGTYSATITVDGTCYTAFARKLGDGVNWNTRYIFGVEAGNNWWAPTSGSQTGNLTLNSDDQSIYFQVAGTYTITIDANAGTFTVTKELDPVATPTFSPASGTTFTGTLDVTISCDTPGATISYSTDGGNTWTVGNTLTLTETTTVMARATKDGMTDSQASATYTCVAPYAVTVSPDGGSLDFGTVYVANNGSATRTITVTNNGAYAVTPVLSALTAPYSTDYTATELASGQSATITITFTPTEEGTFTGNATLSLGNGLNDRTFSLTGVGAKFSPYDHQSTYDVTYKWLPQGATDSIESNLNDIATDPDQIIAMLREVYMNQNIPGSITRGYTDAEASSQVVERYRDKDIYPEVSYQAVGWMNSSHEYVDQYGWNIPPKSPVKSIQKGSRTYYYFDPEDYKPVEGLTLIMLELKDGMQLSGSTSYSNVTSSYSLREMIDATFKSARIISSYKDIEDGTNPGRLYKIDADKLNRYIFLSKGKMRMNDMSENVWDTNNYWWEPSYTGSSNTDNTFGTGTTACVMAPFYHMFEDFSPEVADNSSSGTADHYQELINMEEFYVKHDCTSSVYQGGHHEFNMYGFDSSSEDCQDVRDMMFFIPTYRLKWWYESQSTTGKRDPNERFVNYHPDHLPTMSLYVIHQYEITGEKMADADSYDLTLSWTSNILKYLPQNESEYIVYRVVTDANGNKSYVPVDTISSGETTCHDIIPMQETGQIVTYVIQGKDTTGFLSLQMSNERDYIIPGTDPSNIFSLSPKTDDYARFDPADERNYYANQLNVINNAGTCITSNYLGNGAKFTFYRYEGYNDTQGKKIFEAVSNGNGTLTITSFNQRESNLYHDWIYMPNPSAVTYTVGSNGVVTFNDFSLYDNFYESVADNGHPSLYIYKVNFEASTTIADTDPATDVAHSNQIAVFVHKTDMNIEGYSEQQVIDDTDHSLAIGQRPVTEEVKYSSKTEILRYDAYRWKQYEDNHAVIIDFANSRRDEQTGAISIEQDFAPNGIAGNQAGLYTISMDGENQSENNVTVELSHPVWATFMDKVVENEWGMYTYAPVVETFTTRSDYNTYGGPVQQTGVAKIHSNVVYAEMSSDQNGKGGQPWMEGNKKFTHYTVLLNIDQLLIPVSTSDQLKDYDLYKVRVWRQVKYDLLNEIDYPEQYASKNRNERLANKVTINGEEYGEFLMEELNYDKFSRATVLDANQADGNVLGNSEVTDFYPNWTKSSNEVMATFGAQKLRENDDETGEMITSLPMKFIVRAYYTRSANIDQTTPSGHRAPMRGVDVARDGKYYVAEFQFDYTLDENNPPITSVKGIYTDRVVTGETYYNIMGQSSSEPFEGVNIVVTRYSDGTTTTAKVIK